MIEVLKQNFQSRILEAYFFGSFATNKMHPQSDIDIILVKETQTNFVQRPFEFLDLVDLVPRLDLLVYTPEEFRHLTENPSVGFWTDIAKTMIRFI